MEKYLTDTNKNRLFAFARRSTTPVSKEDIVAVGNQFTIKVTLDDNYHFPPFIQVSDELPIIETQLKLKDSGKAIQRKTRHFTR